MSKSNITGTVDGVSDYGKNDYFNIALDDAEQKDNWFIGDGSTRDFVDGGVEKGDDVRITVDDNKGGVTDIEVVGSGSDQSGEAEGRSDSDARRMGEGAATDSFQLSKQDNIRLQVAFKKAVDTVNHEEELMNEDLNRGERIEAVSSYTNGYYNLLEAQAKDKAGNGGDGQ